MIITINESNRHLYKALFDKASAAIGQSITTLNEYYHYLPDLIATRDNRYLMLPLDETPVEIDAEQRTLKVPSVFTKCASVQNDHIAETIMFMIDRYYDFMDLATTQIYVQWTAPDGEGATKIELIDLSTPNKIRFGWPISKEVTKTQGVVKFSVRFFRQDANNILYSFNTLSSEITVKPALQPEINEETTVEKPVAEGYFTNAVVKSQLSQEGQPNPLNPSFSAPGLDLPTMSALVDDALTMKVQAVVGDTGIMDYTWYYKAEDANEFVEIESDEMVEKLNPQPTSRVDLKEYYVATAGEAGGYEVYAGAIPHPEGKELYEKYSIYSVPATGEVTGTYKVGVTNTLGQNTTVNATWSTPCVLPGPAEISLTSDLQEEVAMTEDASFVSLGIEIAEDVNDPAISYKWYGSSESADAIAEIATETGATYEAVQPGWYQAEAIANLNRKTQTKRSTLCKVTAYPSVPIVSISANIADNEGVIDVGEVDQVTFTVDASIENKAGIAEELYKGSLEYVWMYNVSDSTDGYLPLTEKQPAAGSIPAVVSGLGTPNLVIRNIDDGKSYGYQCVVKHVLNGVEAKVTTDPFIVI